MNFCTKHGIQLQHTVSYTPQRNGVAERKNHTLKEMANCILSINFWVEAITCANYMVNHTPTKVLKNNTPKEALSSVKLDVSHFCVFGSEAWAHIPDEKHKALEHKMKNVFWLDILKMSKDIDFFNLNPKMLSLEEM